MPTMAGGGGITWYLRSLPTLNIPWLYIWWILKCMTWHRICLIKFSLLRFILVFWATKEEIFLEDVLGFFIYKYLMTALIFSWLSFILLPHFYNNNNYVLGNNVLIFSRTCVPKICMVLNLPKEKEFSYGQRFVQLWFPQKHSEYLQQWRVCCRKYFPGSSFVHCEALIKSMASQFVFIAHSSFYL